MVFSIDTILNSVAPLADVLKKLKYQVDKESLENIYFSLIRPQLENGNYIWDNCFEGDKDRLEDFQLSIARTVTGAHKGTSHDLIYSELNWPALADRRKGVKLKNFFKIINNKTPKYLRSLLPTRIGDVRPQSRNPDNYYTVKAKTKNIQV